MIADHDIDRGSLFVTGLSAGGAMTNVMLATYPEVFAAGAIIAGLPYAAAYNLEEALRSMSPGTKRASADWGDRVRAASSHTGAWPRVSIWHGDADTTVHSVNARETVKQWVNVHGLPKQPTFSEQMTGCNHQVWCNERGERQIERYGIARMQHGIPLEPGNDGAKCGTAGRYFLDVGISSSWLIAKFWGLVDVCVLSGLSFPQHQFRSAVQPRRGCDASNTFHNPRTITQSRSAASAIHIVRTSLAVIWRKVTSRTVVYRPERHYMRGPGPRRRRKNA